MLTGVIKLVKEFDNFAPRAVAVNLNEDAILLLNNRAWEPSLMLDSQMNARQIEPYSHHTLQTHVVELSFRQSDSIFTGSSTLEFGQWSMHLGTETVRYLIWKFQFLRTFPPMLTAKQIYRCSAR